MQPHAVFSGTSNVCICVIWSYFYDLLNNFFFNLIQEHFRNKEKQVIKFRVLIFIYVNSKKSLIAESIWLLRFQQVLVYFFLLLWCHWKVVPLNWRETLLFPRMRGKILGSGILCSYIDLQRIVHQMKICFSSFFKKFSTIRFLFHFLWWWRSSIIVVFRDDPTVMRSVPRILQLIMKILPKAKF